MINQCHTASHSYEAKMKSVNKQKGKKYIKNKNGEKGKTELEAVRTENSYHSFFHSTLPTPPNTQP